MSDSEYIAVKEVAPQPPSPNGRAVAISSSSSEGSISPTRDQAEEYLQRAAYATSGAPPSVVGPRKLPPPPSQQRTGMERAAGILRMALPFVQRMLPLLDGNIDAAAPNAHAPQAPRTPPQPPVNIVPLQEGLADLRVQQRALRDQVVEQNTSLKRVEDQLQAVREATDRNTLEQQELLGDLKAVGNKVNVFAFIALALLGVSVILNVVLYLQIRHIIP